MSMYEFKSLDGVGAQKLHDVFVRLRDNAVHLAPWANEDLYEWRIGGNVLFRLNELSRVYNFSLDKKRDTLMGIKLVVLSPGDRPNRIILDLKSEDKNMRKYCEDDVVATKFAYNREAQMRSIKKVIFNDPATIVFWNDRTKTVVKAEDEKFDPEKGLAMAIAKKYFGNQGNYYDIFKKWLPKEEDFGKFMNPPIPEEDEILTVKQFAEKTGQSEVTIRRDCRRGLHPGAVKVDGKWLIPYLGLVGGNENDK